MEHDDLIIILGSIRGFEVYQNTHPQSSARHLGDSIWV
jgi:hypothetical protein